MAHTTQKTVFCETNMQYFDIEQGDMHDSESNVTYNNTVTKLKIHVFINLSTGILGTT